VIPIEPSERHRTIAARFTSVVSKVTDWEAPSPVPEWRAIDVVEWPEGFFAAGGIELPSPSGDPASRWSQRAAAIQGLLDGPDRDSPFTHPMVGTFPLATAIDNFYTSDVFMHAWDLARASGQDDPLDGEEAARLFEGMEPIDAMLRESGQYGPRVAVPDDAPSQDQLMAFIGRDPAWRPGR
jgi:uncharacterized protein (TIGR03086 family)